MFARRWWQGTLGVWLYVVNPYIGCELHWLRSSWIINETFILFKIITIVFNTSISVRFLLEEAPLKPLRHCKPSNVPHAIESYSRGDFFQLSLVSQKGVALAFLCDLQKTFRPKDIEKLPLIWEDLVIVSWHYDFIKWILWLIISICLMGRVVTTSPGYRVQ